MKDGFLRVAAATPKIRVADCIHNAQAITGQIIQAAENNASLIVFPELSVTGYTCSDLFLQSALLDAAEDAVLQIAEKTSALPILSVIGVPLRASNAIYNCAVVLYKGEILGIVPKKNIPLYSEFYEMRHFAAGETNVPVTIGGKSYTITPDILFSCSSMPELVLGVEVCEDLWVPTSPSCRLAENGATLIANLSASSEAVGKPQYRRMLVQMQSAKLVCAYLFADAGLGESTTDITFSGHNIISENGVVLSESKRYTCGVSYADVDLQKITAERRRITTFPVKQEMSFVQKTFTLPLQTLPLQRRFRKNPFVPDSRADVKERCMEILNMQSTGLATRLKHTGVKNAVLGLSGGLDSTLALIVAVHAFDRLKIDRKNILAVTMPCFGTTARTKGNAQKLAQAYGVTFRQIDIAKSVRQHFADIGHDENVLDVTYENAQARERTQVLMDLANQTGGLVIGTGDLSELALGWATYNGDHMSMYAVNASVPKTLVRYITAFEAKNSSGILKQALEDILATPVSPELLPPENGTISQRTEELIGPYDLHDFFLYYFMRYGFTPTKIYRMAKLAFAGEFSEKEIHTWLCVFFKRFFSQQFKRSCMPDGPKVGSVTLSPRGDFRMPSDAAVRVWLEELKKEGGF